MRLSYLAVIAACVIGPSAWGANVTVDPLANWIGFMNVSETPQHGGGFVFGSAWGTTDLRATFSGPVLTLAPNSVADPSSFWYTPGGGPGAVGNKTMDANMYVETNGVFTGQTLTFSGNVLSNTLVGEVNQIGNGWTGVAFIRDYAPDYSTFVGTTFDLDAGPFSLSLNTVNDPARHIQYGFETIGPDVWPTDANQYGTIQVSSVPEPATLALLLPPTLLARRRRPRR